MRDDACVRILVCEGAACRRLGAAKVRHRAERLAGCGDTSVLGVSCLHLCLRGPNVVVYPEGNWYSFVTPGRLDRLMSEEGEAMRQQLMTFSLQESFSRGRCESNEERRATKQF